MTASRIPGPSASDARAPQTVRPVVRRLFGSLGVFVAVVVVAAAQAVLRNDLQVARTVLPQSAATAALSALVASYSYMHYFFDGRMWKLISTDARLRAELGTSSSAG